MQTLKSKIRSALAAVRKYVTIYRMGREWVASVPYRAENLRGGCQLIQCQTYAQAVQTVRYRTIYLALLRLDDARARRAAQDLDDTPPEDSLARWQGLRAEQVILQLVERAT